MKHGVAVELFLTPSTYCDVATLGSLCNTTGGQLHLFQNYKVHSKGGGREGGREGEGEREEGGGREGKREREGV